MIYQIMPSIEPLIEILFYVHENSEELAVEKLKKHFKFEEHELTSSYSKSRYADCFSCSISDLEEKELLEFIEKNKQSNNTVIAYIDLNNKLHSSDLQYFISAWNYCL